ncbi:hypothetical protein [Pasteurella multocida]|uniref:hypothetical protein n=1 Tax=Pasteurella multocida TaxID=747 RepID=UPI000D3BD25E|nr:hypothetical protein [Pasteurella multocida]AWB52370.1 hypothetical protein DB278_02145 [Pasteurella multocida]
MKKYELLKNDMVKFENKTLYRIRALRRFGDIIAGQLGGYIESENNLDHDGNAWVADNALVYDNAFVSDNALVSGNAWVFGNARIYNNAWVFEDAQVYGDAYVLDNAQVYGNSFIYGNAWVRGNARVFGKVLVSGDARVEGFATISTGKMIFFASHVGFTDETITVFNGRDGLIVAYDSFCGTTDEFLEYSKNVHDEKTHHEFKLLIEVAKSRILK